MNKLSDSPGGVLYIIYEYLAELQLFLKVFQPFHACDMALCKKVLYNHAENSTGSRLAPRNKTFKNSKTTFISKILVKW